MKAIKIIYWVSTIITGAMMAFSAYSYLARPEMQQAFQHLGFPEHFRVELAIAKLLGAVVLLTPVPARLKEWAYVGFTFTFIAAFIAHTAASDPVKYRAMPLVFLVVLAVSYLSWRRLQQSKQV